MDIVRVRRRTPLTRLLIPAAIALLVAGGVWSLMSVVHPRAAEPVVARDSVVTDVVQRVPFAPAVRASGRLASQRVFAISAASEGIVTSLPIRPGTAVAARTIVATLTNPDLDAAVVNAQAQLRAAQAVLASVREQADASHLDSVAARTASVAQAGEDADASASDRRLHADGYISDLVYHGAAIKAAASHALVAIAAEKVNVDAAQSRANIAAAQARVEQLAAQVTANRAQLATLTVRAGAAGVVQTVPIEVGARLSSGAQIAQVADGRDLKAVLDVPENEAHAVGVGMPAAIDVQNQSLPGHVARIDPAAQNGSVTVDVVPDRAFPSGARPESSIDGTIALAAPHRALTIARPASAVDGQPFDLYRVVDAGTRAVRTRVTFGIGSDDRLTIVAGLRAGDTVIVSDMSAANGAASVRLQ